MVCSWSWRDLRCATFPLFPLELQLKNPPWTVTLTTKVFPYFVAFLRGHCQVLPGIWYLKTIVLMEEVHLSIG